MKDAGDFPEGRESYACSCVTRLDEVNSDNNRLEMESTNH